MKKQQRFRVIQKLILILILGFGINANAQRITTAGGTFTIDSSGTNTGTNYINFTAAITDLNIAGTLTGSVIFNVNAGQTFTGNTPAITNTGYSGITITFQKSGTGANPVIQPIGTTGALDFGICIKGADYVSFDGIDINSNNNTAVEFGFLVINDSANNGAWYNTIKNCQVLLSSGISTTRCILQSANASYGGAVSATSIAGINKGNTYNNITMGNTNSCIWMYGVSTTYKDSGNVVTNCTIGRSSVPNDIGGNLANAVYVYYFYYQDYPRFNNNVITNVANTTTLYNIYGSTDNNVQINNNIISNITNAGGTLYHIYVSTTNTLQVYNNRVSNINAGGILYQVYLLTTQNTTVDSNNFSNCTSTGTLYLTYVSTGTNVIVRNNTYNNMSCAAFFGLYTVTVNTASVYNNTVSNIIASGTMCCTYNTTPTKLSLYNNTLRNLFSTGGNVFGLQAATATGNTSATTANNIYNNVVDNIGSTSTGTTAYTVYGLYNTNVATSNVNVNIYNNVIGRLVNTYAPSTATASKYLFGMYFGTTANTTTNTHATYNIYQNTVSIDQGSALNYTSATMYFAPTAHTTLVPIYNINNNHLANTTTAQTGVAKHYIMWSQSSGGNYLGNVSSTCNYNNYYFPDTVNGYFGYANSADIFDKAAWTTAFSTFDANSITAAPQFNSNTVLRPLPGSPLLGAGTALTGYTTDILGITRSVTTPTIGAYEQGGDAIPPTITYTPLLNAYSLTNRTTSNFATIIDNILLDLSGGTAPRLYYKKISNNNVFGANNSSTNGWKWVGIIGSVSPFNFTINYSLLTGGAVSVGDTIQYFVIAQDTSSIPNVAANPSTGFAGTSVASITTAPIPNYYIVVSSSPVVPVVSKNAAINITVATATLGGTILTDGGSTIMASGVVYGTNPNPALSGTGVIDSATNPVVVNGTFTVNPTGLTHSTKYYFRAYATNSVGTAYSSQDSFTTLPIISTLPYTQNFDSAGNTGWSSAIVGGSINEWVVGTPNKTQISAAYSSPNCWVTKLSGTYTDNTNAAVVSPQFDFTSQTADPILRFRHNFITEANYDGAVVEISINNGTWTKVDATLGTGGNFNTTNSTSWYNNSSTSGPLTPPKWSSNSNLFSSNVSNWIQSITILTGAAGQSNVKFRIRFASDGSGGDEGWAFDDIEVFSPSAPTIGTGTKTNITLNSVTLAGNITNNGGAIITASGVVVGYTASPVRGGGGVIDSATNPLVSSGSFSLNIAGLYSSVTYHYRAYSVNAIGTSYGADSTFTTNSSAVIPTVLRIAASNITTTTLTFGGNITSDGGSTVTASGVVYATTPNPALYGTGVIDSTTNPLVTTGTYLINPTGLAHSTKYYYRAYAANSIGLAYSIQDSFMTSPIISTLPYTQSFDSSGNTGWTSAIVAGTLNDWIVGTPSKTTLSAAYSTPNAWVTKLTANYSTSHNAALVSPQFDFSANSANPILSFKHKFYTESCCDGGYLEISLDGGITWTKVENSIGTGGNFNTTNGTAWYNLTTQGNSWGNLSSAYSTAANGWITSVITLPGAGGQSNVKIRFHFISDSSIEYEGWEIDNIEVFLPTAPIVITGTKTNITMNSVTLAGNITNNGGATITASGVVIGYTASPVRGGGSVIDSATTPLVGNGSFSVNVAGLSSSVTYHYRAYSVNAIGTSYGADSTFTTNSSAVIPTVLRIAASNFTTTTATFGGNITSDGGSTVTASGVVYATTPNPALYGSGVIDSTTNPLITTGTYLINPTGLAQSTKYYYRAYATNSIGLAYSIQDSFMTSPIISTLPYTQNFDIAGNTGWSSAIVSGSINEWIVGTPTKTQISAAYSSPNCWVTNLYGTYSNNTNAAVVSPQFDFSGLSSDPVLSFRHVFKTETGWDGAVIEVSTNGGINWVRVDSTLGTGGNFNTSNSYSWYNNTSTSGPLLPAKWSSNSNLFSSNASNWIQSQTRLTGTAGQPNVKFRIRFASDASGVDEGWAFDDVQVFVVATPTTQASSVTIGTITNASVNVSWTNGNGSSRIVIARQTSATVANPVDWKLYNANTIYGSGDTSGAGNYIVYKGTDTSVTVTGLTLLTNYTFSVYEFNGSQMHVMFKTPAVSNNATTLPVTLLNFSAKNVKGDVVLDWSTASELNNSGFDIERSVDGNNFTFLRFVKGMINSSQIQKYTSIDERAFEAVRIDKLYYRLKQIDLNGKYAYCGIVSVDNKETILKSITSYPNPFNQNLTLEINSGAKGKGDVNITDVRGVEILSKQITVEKGNNKIDLIDFENLSNGIYFVRVLVNGDYKTMKVTKIQ